MTAALELFNVSKRYGSFQAVRDLSQRFALGHPRLGPGSCVICHGEEAERSKFEKLVPAAPAGPGARR